MNDNEKKTIIPPLRYVDDNDRAWQERMQEPEVQDYIRNTFLDIQPEDWPDAIFLADLPQVPEEQINSPIIEKIGRCEGPIRKTGDVTIVPTDIEVTFFRPESTRFVRVILKDGREVMERYAQERHGEWEQIPNTGLTPAELIERLYGFGTTETNQGQQLKNERKKPGGASQTNWKAQHYPSPRVRGLRGK